MDSITALGEPSLSDAKTNKSKFLKFMSLNGICPLKVIQSSFLYLSDKRFLSGPSPKISKLILYSLLTFKICSIRNSKFFSLIILEAVNTLVVELKVLSSCFFIV